MNHVSRRSLLGTVAALPAIAVPAVACATEHPLVTQMRVSRESANAKFWRLHAELEALEAQWAAIPDDDDDGEREVGKLVHAKFDEVMMQGVFCPLAVLAKLKLVRFDAESFSLPNPAKTAAQIIEWDLERCAKEKLLAPPS